MGSLWCVILNSNSRFLPWLWGFYAELGTSAAVCLIVKICAMMFAIDAGCSFADVAGAGVGNVCAGF